MYRPTFAIVDTGAIRNNVRAIRSLLQPQTRLLTAVKANGYGHGAQAAAIAALTGGATDLGVASVEEALELRAAGITAPILVLGVTSAAGILAAAEQNIAVTVGGPEGVQETAGMTWTTQDAATGKRLQAAVHLKVDTGMSRLGVRGVEAAVDLARRIDSSPRLQLAGVFTHLACSDEPDLCHTEAQVARFRTVVAAIEAAGIAPGVVHAANSAATLRRPDWHFDMVRVGISAYGYGSAEGFESPVALQPGLHLYGCITRVATLEVGDTVSYGASFTASRRMRVATLPVGYADGYFRTLSNRASVIVHNRRAPVVGRVCMDQLMVDVSDIPNVRRGDCATLYGRYAPPEWTANAMDSRANGALEQWLGATFTARAGASVLSLDELAAHAGTISYEMMCALSPRVPRTVLPL